METVKKSLHMNGLKHDLMHHCGSENLYQHWYIKKFVYSEGARDYMLRAGAQWLGDMLATEFVKPIMELTPDIHYLKIKIAETKMDITLHDYQGNLIKEKHIKFTDHVDGEMDFILGWDRQRVTWCLTSEN